MDRAFELARQRVLNQVNVFDEAEDLANLRDHLEGVSVGEVDNLQLGVQARHHLAVLVDNLTLAEGLLHEGRRRIFLFHLVRALRHEIGIAAQELGGGRNDTR